MYTTMKGLQAAHLIPVMWDVNSAIGRYLNTDFIIYDEKGNLMYCIARGNIAHNFLCLKKGAIYSVKNFTVQPNKDDFCVFRFAHFIVEMDRDTVVRNSSVRPGGFARYPFQLVEFDSLEPTNNKYLIGKALNRCCWGQSIRVTLWGGLGKMLIEKRTQRVGLYLIILTAMSVKLYNNRLYLSSTLSTMIVDDEQIPILKQLKSDDSGIQLAKELLSADSTGAKAGTLENLLMWAFATFYCAVRIDKIKTKRGWNYPSCGGEKCKKGNLDRKYGRFWCDSCHSFVDYPVLRYRLELEVSDDTAQTVVVMFDEMASTVVKYSAGLIVRSEEQDEEETVLPLALANIVGTLYNLELKSNSYFEHANYESFTCWIVVLEEALDESRSSGTLAAVGDPKTGVFVPLTTTPSVTTPLKPGEHKKPRRSATIPMERNHLWQIVRQKGAMWVVHLKSGKGEGPNIQSQYVAKYEFRKQPWSQARPLQQTSSSHYYPFKYVYSKGWEYVCCLKLTDICIIDTAASSMAQKRATKLKGKAIADASNVAPPKTCCKSTGAASISKRITIHLKRKAIADPNNVATTKTGRTTIGKVLLPRFKGTPELLKRLLDYTQPTTAAFRDLIRVYNGMFCFTSFGAKIDHSINKGRGLYTFRINRQNYHRIGSLLPTEGTQPSEEGVDGIIVGSLIRMLDANSAIAKAFQMARDWCHADATANVELRLLSERTRSKQYNAPNVTEVAALITNDFGDGEPTRDIVIFQKDGPP
ncbi:reverse transcriptase domain-containing protein, partial [Tanacetum coccineum]